MDRSSSFLKHDRLRRYVTNIPVVVVVVVVNLNYFWPSHLHNVTLADITPPQQLDVTGGLPRQTLVHIFALLFGVLVIIFGIVCFAFDVILFLDCLLPDFFLSQLL